MIFHPVFKTSTERNFSFWPCHLSIFSNTKIQYLSFVYAGNSFVVNWYKNLFYLIGSQLVPKGSFPSIRRPKVPLWRKLESGGSCINVSVVKFFREYENLIAVEIGSTIIPLPHAIFSLKMASNPVRCLQWVITFFRWIMLKSTLDPLVFILTPT